ncbi:hypothetical protein P879_07376 [Paragonimus westermani]|uniref:Uncharacterized protein n=1 Tax=Paragonimus westermani TaxID=34504 RepID=A0A8T0DUF9_9TREM|nr:hypothetical protein P879_07376 [Paragonimus westermani]
MLDYILGHLRASFGTVSRPGLADVDRCGHCVWCTLHHTVSSWRMPYLMWGAVLRFSILLDQVSARKPIDSPCRPPCIGVDPGK